MLILYKTKNQKVLVTYVTQGDAGVH